MATAAAGSMTPDRIVHPTLGRPSMVCPFVTPDGSLIGFESRDWTLPSGRKVPKMPLPLTPLENGTWDLSTPERYEKDDKGGWAANWGERRPLSGQDLLVKCPEATVIVCEGPKAMFAAQRLLPAPRFVCVCWPGGFEARRHVDFSPLRDRKVVWWPDADGQGHECMIGAAGVAAVDTNGTLKQRFVVPPPGVEKGWDAADAEAEGWTPEKAVEYLRANALQMEGYWAKAEPVVASYHMDNEEKARQATAKREEGKRKRKRKVALPAPLGPGEEAQEGPPADPDDPGPDEPKGPTPEELNGDGGPIPPAYSEDALALLFAGRRSEDLRYCGAWGQWLRWDGTRWARDELGETFEEVRALCREKSEEWKRILKFNGKPEGPARAMAGIRFVSNVERFAGFDGRHRVGPDRFDADPFLLGTPEGVVDLRTGEMAPPRREAYVTRSTRVAPAPGPVEEGGACPRWLEFLQEATGGDEAVIGYLQRVAGYCLTGTVREHVAFFLFGPAKAGKSTFTAALMDVMGDYAMAQPVELLTPQGHEHPTLLARLVGVRLVVLPETEEGRAIAESRFKSLVAGDRMAARFMREDYFDFDPQCKVVFHGNHRPRLRSTDESMRRRLHVVPFEQVVPPERVDKGLRTRLQAEGPGILRWAIEGCLLWQQEGLKPPEAVAGAVESYFEGEDALGRWLDECCILGQQYDATSRLLWGSWKNWAEVNGEHPRSQRWLSQQLEGRGFQRDRFTDGVRGFKGIGIIDSRQAEPRRERRGQDGYLPYRDEERSF